MRADDVASLVRRGWGLPVDTARNLAVGLDSGARAYEASTAGGGRYFVKVRSVPAGPAAVLVPRFLHAGGLTAVVAALSTSDGEPWLDADGHQILVYPYVDGGNGWEPGLTDTQWTEYARFLATLHAVTLPPELAALVPTETFDPPSLARVRAVTGRIRSAEPGSSPSRRALLAFWRPRSAEITGLAARTGALRDRAAAAGRPHVLCHADIHTGNVLVGPGGLSIVDWDAPILAPRERDLMFVYGGPWGRHPVTAEQRARFRAAYGDARIDPATLAYYLYERVIDDISQFADRILADDVTEDEKAEELYWLRGCFEPGDAADRARAATAASPASGR